MPRLHKLTGDVYAGGTLHPDVGTLEEQVQERLQQVTGELDGLLGWDEQ